MNNDPDNCSDGLQTFSQHAGECWNDSISNLLFFTPRLAPLVRAKTAAEFQAWITSPRITAWLQERFRFKNARQLELFVYYASQYVSCLKERFENWKQRRITVNATRRRRSCVYSKCSESSGIIASEILQLQINPERNRINANIMKALKNNNMPVNMVAQIERGLTMEMRNYAYNFSIVQKNGYNVETFAKFVSILLYFYFDQEVLLSLDTEPPAGGIFAFGELEMDRGRLFSIMRKHQPSHHINLILHVSLHFMDVSHAIHLLTCANNKQYVYDNNNKTFISSKWLSYFMTPYDDFVQGFYISSRTNYEKNNLIFELLVRFVTYLNFEMRTYEQIDNIITRTVKMQEGKSRKYQYEFFYNLVFKHIGIHPDCKDFLWDGFELDPTQKPGEIHSIIETKIGALITNSLFFKLFEEHKPSFYALTTTHLYLICKESVKKVSIEKLKTDHLWNVAIYLLKTPKNAILFLMNMYNSTEIYMIDSKQPTGFVMFTPK